MRKKIAIQAFLQKKAGPPNAQSGLHGDQFLKKKAIFARASGIVAARSVRKRATAHFRMEGGCPEPRKARRARQTQAGVPETPVLF